MHLTTPRLRSSFPPLLLALFSLLVIFSACKDNSEDEIKNKVPKVKTMIQYMNDKVIFESNYIYDATGRLIKYSDSNHASFEYIYSQDWVIITGTYTGMNINDTLLLNDKGLYIGQLPVTAYEYDSQGYRIKKTSLINNIQGLATYEIGDGNTVHWIEKAGKDYENVDHDEEYEFLPNSTNTIGNENMGTHYHGRQNKNLMSGIITSYHSATGIEKLRVKFEYQLDDLKRVIKQSTVNKPGNYIVFTYY